MLNGALASILILQHSSFQKKNKKEDFSSWRIAKFVSKAFCWLTVITVAFFALYYALASPPMHWVYEVAPPAGPSSVYIPGGGFSGFWFHLGFLHSIANKNDYDYYCFSSGCLGIIAILMNRSLEETMDAAFSAQDTWRAGNISRFEVAGHFFDDLVPLESEEAIHHFLPNLKILVTTTKNGFEAKEPKNIFELRDLIIKTTWVPYLTGWGILSDDEDMYFDGGFSRLLHPKCEFRLDLPLIWDTIIHSFSPGLTREQVRHLWRVGHRSEYNIPKQGTQDIAAASSHRSGSAVHENTRLEWIGISL